MDATARARLLMHKTNRESREGIEHHLLRIALIGAAQVMQLQLDIGLAKFRIGAHIGVRGGPRHAHRSAALNRQLQRHGDFGQWTLQLLVQCRHATRLDHQPTMQMINQILAHTRKRMAGRDAQAGQSIRCADARELEQLRRLDRARAQNDIATAMDRIQAA